MSGGNLRGIYHVRRKFKRGISLLYHGCYCSNHGINIYNIYVQENAWRPPEGMDNPEGERGREAIYVCKFSHFVYDCVLW